MRGPGSRLSRGVGRVMLGVTAVAAAAALLAAPVAVATPESDASDAIDQAWQAIGGDESNLGAKDGDVYAVGDGFGQNFADGVYYFTPATGAHMLYGDVLAKYRALGGPADSDLGFPTIDEVTGLVSPDSRVSTFSASDKPAIFWTPDTGAWVVRGAINAAWDKLGGSSGSLGVPIADETYNGDVVDQKFANGELSWNRATKAFTTVPAELVGQLTDVVVPSDATSAINEAWRAAGGLSGPLGARQGAQSTIGATGAAQPYVGGKIFYSPETGARAVTGAILSKYESAGGPTGDLGYPIGTEADGGAPNSRVSSFSAQDKPIIFWTPDTGAIVVRGAINAAWAKLGGATGKLGVPTAQQTVSGDTVTQKFTGGELSWNKSTGKFASKPGDLAAGLSDVDVPKGAAAGVPNDDSHKGFSWHWWWLLVIIPAFLLVGVIAFGIVGWQRRRAARNLHDDWPHELESGPSVALTSSGSSGSGSHLDRDVEHPDSDGWSAPKRMPGEDDIFDGDQDALDTTPTRIPVDPGRSPQEPVLPDSDGHAELDGVSAVEEYDEPLDVEEEVIAEEINAGEISAEEFDAEEEFDDGADPNDDDFVDEVTAEAQTAAVAEAEPQDDWAEIEAPRRGRHSAHAAGESPFTWTIDTGRPSGRRRAASERSDDRDAEPPSLTPTSDPGRSARHTKSDPNGDLDPSRPAIHLPLSDPYQPPEGYPIKANTHSGLYYTPDCDLYDHTVPEVWFATEELAQANGFVKAE